MARIAVSLVSMPQIFHYPWVFFTRPARILMKVDLPAPFGPNQAEEGVPRGIARSTPFSAWMARRVTA